MKPIVSILVLLTVAGAGCVSVGSSQNAVIRAKEKVAPALVHVRPVKEVFTRGERKEVSVIGSGFIITPDGIVVTNEHVAGDSSYVRCVLFDKTEVDAKVIGTDPYSDIAVLKLQTDRTDLPYVTLGKSANLTAGQTVLALGSPHGLARSVSLGIVSVTDRNLETLRSTTAPYNNWIQTDAAINPGNSGGPLVNIRGEVIGINTRKLSGADNVGFAIPIDIAKEVIEEIIEHGKVTRSTIGIEFQEMMSVTEDATRRGVIIADVDPLSPAFEARLRPGDVLLAINGHPTDARFREDLPSVRKLIADIPIGASVDLKIQRNDQIITIPVVTEEKSERQGKTVELKAWGFTVAELTVDVIRRAQLTSRQGVLVTGTQVGGLAALASLQPRDIILEVDGRPVVNLASFREMYDATQESGHHLVMLRLKRGALTMFALVKQESGGTPPSQ